ncbi:phosphate propanoyltransferase [Companilactobacillus suantsaicola]|uniref:Phosphate propanoyltransferase n=1 Tax=Companilactobacillus suantsaicola TaxID=2487723 RepID=A0A4Z0JS92_9LACO|nr:phosphate propanoyltransferase [Companilactobacillus suantsaicola]TGD24847.1 phosphate propanoyltransferase [Companilactobacillus suantsaicola]
MEDYEKLLEKLVINLTSENQTSVSELKNDNHDLSIPVGVSNRHIHLCQNDLEKLFGHGYELNPLKDLSQPGQYASKETVILCGPKGSISKVRILGPVRSRTQVEVLRGDTYKLGIKAPLRLSGDLDNSGKVTVIGPNGSIELNEGAIVAQRHIHMLPSDAQRFGVKDGDIVTIVVEGDRGGELNNVAIRAKNNSGLECHIDTEEANALGMNSKSRIRIKK